MMACLKAEPHLHVRSPGILATTCRTRLAGILRILVQSLNDLIHRHGIVLFDASNRSPSPSQP